MPPMVHQLVMTDDEVNLQNWLEEYPMDINTTYRKEKPIEATLRYNSMKCLKICLNRQETATFKTIITEILMQAIYKRNKKAIKIIIAHYGNEEIGKYDINDHSLLEIIIKLDDVERLKTLYDIKVDVFTKDGNGCSPLYFATIYRAFKCKTFLYGLQPEMSLIMSPNEGSENVFLEVMQANDYDAFKIIINREEFKEYIDQKYVEDRTHLHYAVRYGFPKIVKQLIKKGVNVNAQDRCGDTPLHETESVEIAKILLNAGADVSIKNNMNKTPEDLANYVLNGNNLAICQWFILLKKPEERKYGENRANNMENLIKGHPSLQKCRRPKRLPFKNAFSTKGMTEH